MKPQESHLSFLTKPGIIVHKGVLAPTLLFNFGQAMSAWFRTLEFQNLLTHQASESFIENLDKLPGKESSITEFIKVCLTKMQQKIRIQGNSSIFLKVAPFVYFFEQAERGRRPKWRIESFIDWSSSHKAWSYRISSINWWNSVTLTSNCRLYTGGKKWWDKPFSMKRYLVTLSHNKSFTLLTEYLSYYACKVSWRSSNFLIKMKFLWALRYSRRVQVSKQVLHRNPLLFSAWFKTAPLRGYQAAHTKTHLMQKLTPPHETLHA